jgi:hypothetical protein
MVTSDLCGCAGRAEISPDPRSEVRELGDIDVAAMPRATLDPATYGDALRELTG